jgi:hypothetical protein
VLVGLHQPFPAVRLLWADTAYRGLADWLGEQLGWSLEITRHWWTGARVWVAAGQPPPERPAGFQVLKRRWVVETQSARLSQYAGEAIVIRNSQPVGEGDTMISTEIQGGKLQQPIQVDWRVRERDGDYRIIDVLIAGVSMVVTYRNEFQAIVERGGAEALKAELAARAGKS